jgi:hypothetical protein
MAFDDFQLSGIGEFNLLAGVADDLIQKEKKMWKSFPELERDSSVV